MIPKFQHDCDLCIFLGHFHNHDVYFCPKSREGSLVARFDNDGPDYASAPVSVLPTLFTETSQVEYVQAWEKALQSLKPLTPILEII